MFRQILVELDINLLTPVNVNLEAVPLQELSYLVNECRVGVEAVKLVNDCCLRLSRRLSPGIGRCAGARSGAVGRVVAVGFLFARLLQL